MQWSHHLLPLLIDRPGGLLVEVTDGATDYNASRYRISVFYDLAKVAVNRLAFSQGHALKPHGGSAVAITPGGLRSEMMLDNFGGSEANWRDAVDRTPPTSRSPSRLDTSHAPSSRSRRIPIGADGTSNRSAPRSSHASTGSPTSTAPSPTSGAGYNRRMRPTLVLLVRHGQTPTTGKVLPGQAPGLHLAEEGQRQANVVAARIDKLPKVAAVYASQLERARETALPIARTHGLAVRVDRDLADGDVGEWTGQKLRRLARKPEWQTVQRHPSGFRFPGGESFIEMQTRVVSALARIFVR